MNIKVTVRLLVLLGLILGAIAILDRDRSTQTQPLDGPFFDGLTASDVVRIEIEDRTAERLPRPVTLRRDGARWVLQCELIARGEPVGASANALDELLEALRTARPLRLHAAEPSEDDALRAGLSESTRIAIRASRANGETFGLDFGSRLDGAGTVAVRPMGERVIYAVDRYFLDALVPSLAALEDAALIPKSRSEVQKLTVRATDGSPRFSIARDFDRWRLQEPFQALADPTLCDRVLQSVLGLRILGREPKGTTLASADIAAIVTLEAPLGVDPLEIAFGKQVAQGTIPARVLGSPDVVRVHAEVLNQLDQDPRGLRDRKLLAVIPSRIQRIRVDHRGAARNYLRIGESWQVQFGSMERPRPLDPSRAAEFLLALTDLQARGFTEATAPIEAEWVLEIVHEVRGATAPITDEIRIGSLRSDGTALASVRGSADVAVVGADALRALAAPVERQFERKLWGTDAYFRIARLEISDRRDPARHKRVAFRGYLPEAGADLAAELIEREGGPLAGAKLPLSVPATILAPAKERLIHTLTIHEWLPYEQAPSAQEPSFVVRWFEAQDATDRGIPLEPKGAWRELAVFPQRADGLLPGTLDGDVKAAFTIDPAELNPFHQLMDWALR